MDAITGLFVHVFRWRIDASFYGVGVFYFRYLLRKACSPGELEDRQSLLSLRACQSTHSVDPSRDFAPVFSYGSVGPMAARYRRTVYQVPGTR